MKKCHLFCFELLLVSVLCSGCSLLQNRYADRSKIAEDYSTSKTQAVEVNPKVQEANVYQKDYQIVTVDELPDVQPLISEKNVVDQTVREPIIASTETIQSTSDNLITKSQEKVENIKTSVSDTIAEKQSSSELTGVVGDTGVQELKVIQTSNAMIPESFTNLPEGAVLYVEDVACDAPLVYKTSKLTASVIASYAKSGKFKMASQSNIDAMRSKLEYRDVANGDWSSLASLARAQKFDYVFYGAIGKESSAVYLTYYLIRVDSGEIIWESTRTVK